MAHPMLMLAPGPEWGSAGPVGPWAEVWVKDPCERFAADLLCPPLPGTIAPQRCSPTPKQALLTDSCCSSGGVHRGLDVPAWQVAVLPKLANCAMRGLLQKKCNQQVKGGDSAPLLRSRETPPAALRSALGPPTKEGHGPVGASPEEGHEDGQRAGAPLL